MKTYNDLDPLLHSQLRLAIISLLISVEEAEFGFIRDTTKATAGNISVQLNKLKDAGYIKITKKFQRELSPHDVQNHSQRSFSL